MTQKSNVIAIGYAKRALVPHSRERTRMVRYAQQLRQYHLIVFTKHNEGFPAVQQEGNLYVYATNAYTKLGMLWRAIRIGRTILKSHNEWSVVSSQDPFETALVGRAVSFGNRATNHVQIHGDVFNPLSSNGQLLQRLRIIYGKYVVRHTPRIRVVSKRIKHSLELLGVSVKCITVLPIHADLETFFKVGEMRSHVVSGNLSFLYVGRFSKEKNLRLLINSFAEVAKKYSQSSLTLLGSGPEKDNLERLVAFHSLAGRVRFEPWSDEVSVFMAQHDVLCLSSDHEGWGMVMLEAAAAGMPIITTAVGCAGECVRDNENGHVVLVGDTEQYAAAMEQYLIEPGLVSTHGDRSTQIAKEVALSEAEYIQQLVDSFTFCREDKPVILTSNGKT